MVKKNKDLYHNTPALFDEYMVENGTVKYREDGRIEYMMKGYMNGKEGVFHTTVKNGDTVIHKNFISAEKWDNYIKEKDLPKYNNIK